MKRLICLLLVCTFSISSTAHAAEIRTVALSGQQAPGRPDGTLFTSFDINSPIMLNDAGKTAFWARTSDSNLSGIWSEGAGSLNLVAEPGQQAPGLPDGVTYDTLINNNDRRLVINDACLTAFGASFTPSIAPSTSGFGNFGFWASGPGGSTLIAHTGEQAVGMPAGVVYEFNIINRTSLAFNDAGQTAFSAGSRKRW